MKSDQKISYYIRPSKSIERKMMLEVIREVCTPTVANSYMYVGFGASFFVDFKLVHSSLRINEMISIEGNKDRLNQVRCLYNKPFKTIKLKFGLSKNVLPKLDWQKRAIVWLDYDELFSDYMIEDIETCCEKLLPNSFIIITLKKEFPNDSDLDECKKNFRSDYMPAELRIEDIQPDNAATTMNKIFTNVIKDKLAKRCAHDENKLVFKLLFNMVYKDSTSMYTFGGVIIDKNDEEKFKKYEFNKYEYINTAQPYNISFPIVTYKEIHTLNKFLPCTKKAFDKVKEIKFIPEPHRTNYFNVYKYYPTYIEIKDL